MKKFVSILLTVVMAMGLVACSSNSSTGSSSQQEGSSSNSNSDKKYTVGICQLVQHEALDAATKGFKDELNKELGEGTVTFDEQNAQGDSATCSTIINGFVSNNVDLILANATPAL